MDKDRLETFEALIGNSSKSLTRLKSRYMSLYGLGSTHTVCLRKLYSEKGKMTRSRLAELCEIDKSQITRVVGELVQKGYILESCDGHRKEICLSDEGCRVTEEINNAVMNVLDFVSGEIPSEKIEAFYDIFSTICEKLKKAEEFDWSKAQKTKN